MLRSGRIVLWCVGKHLRFSSVLFDAYYLPPCLVHEKGPQCPLYEFLKRIFGWCKLLNSHPSLGFESISQGNSSSLFSLSVLVW